MFFAIDACFKLKQKAHGYNDVPLADGLAYIVPQDHYREVLDNHVDEPEVSN